MDRLNTCIEELSRLGITGHARQEYVNSYSTNGLDVHGLEKAISKEYLSRAGKNLGGTVLIGALSTDMILTSMYLEKVKDSSNVFYASLTAMTIYTALTGESILICNTAKNLFKAGKYYLKSRK